MAYNLPGAFMLFVHIRSDQVIPGLMGTRQAMLADHPAGVQEGIAFSQRYDLAFEGRRNLVGTGFGDSRQFLQAGQTFLPIAVQPLADGLGGAERSGRRA